MLTENEVNAKAFIIGRQLERKDWFNMSATEANSWSKDKARNMGADDTEAEAIATLAMLFVIKGNY